MTTTDENDEKSVDPLEHLGRCLGLIKDDEEDRR